METAIVLIVKSRREISSANVPSETVGLRLDLLYDSFLAATNSKFKP